jgi:hypothetical protein
MLKLGATLVFAGSLSMILSACGGDDGEEGGLSSGAANGSGASGGSTPINVGGMGAGAAVGDPNNDGGIIELTPEEIDAIENSACAGWTTEGENLPAVLFMVNDVSGSMEQSSPGTNGASKWSVTHDSLVSALNNLPGSTAVGIISYPNVGDDTGESTQPRDIDECVATNELVTIDLLGDMGSAQRNALENHLNGANTGGGTPTHDAYRHGLIYGMLPYVTNYKRFMLIITDGQPTYSQNCVGNGNVDQNPPIPVEPIIDEIASANEMGIRTFVIGSPGSEEGFETGEDYRPWMSRAAVEGGTAPPGCNENGPDNYCHMDMTQAEDFSAALNAGLEQIAGQLNSCTYAIASPPDGQQIDLNQINMIVTFADGSTELILRDDNGDCSEGWQLNAEQQVELCGATCGRVQGDMQSHVELLFGCASGEVPIVR